MAKYNVRSEAEETRGRRITIRLTPEEYERVMRTIARTPHQTISIYARRMLLGKPVTILYHDSSKDKAMEELSALRRELGALANNFNQVVKRLHKLDTVPNKEFWLRATYNREQELLRKIEGIQRVINKISELWLRASSQEKK